MKNVWKVLAVPAAAAFLLAGCGDDDEVKNPPVTENEDQAGLTPDKNEGAENEKLSVTYKNFDLEVNYDKDQSYEADYDAEDTETEASIEDERDGTELHGDEAMKDLQPKLEKLTFNEDTDEEEVINQVTSAFGIKDEYQSIELEVVFDNGEKREYKAAASSK